nr:MAG TPA: hypothetical protein [Caudoviricetes sp.]
MSRCTVWRLIFLYVIIFLDCIFCSSCIYAEIGVK